MSYCINKNAAENHAARTNSTNYEPPSGGMDQKSRKKMQREQEEARAAREAAINAVNRIINADTPQGSPMTGTDRAGVTKAAKQLKKLHESAVAAQQKAAKEYASFIKTFSSSTTSDASWWLRLTNGLSRVLADSTAPIVRWAVQNIGVEGSNVMSHPLIQALRLMHARPYGLQGEFYEALLKVKNSETMQRIVRGDSSKTADDVLKQAADYLTYLHMPERNRHLLEVNWPRELEEIERNPKLTDAERSAARLRITSQIEALRRELNSTNPSKGTLSGGLTNGQAEQLRRELIAESGISEADFLELATGLRDAVQVITEKRIAEGLVQPDIVAAWPEFEWYIPIKTEHDNLAGAMNDIDVYDPGKYHAISGTDAPLQNGLSTIVQYGWRASNEIGMRDFTSALSAAYLTSTAQGRDIGLQSYDYDSVLRALNDANPYRRNWAASILDANRGGGGVVALLPNFDAKGNPIESKRVLLTWRHDYQFGNMTGADLNKALVTKVKGSELTNRIGTATSFYGQMFTRFQPLVFSPVNMVRDIVERATNITSREYRDRDGNVVAGHTLLMRYGVNTKRASGILFKALRGNLEPGTVDYEIWQDFKSHGLHLQYMRGMKELRETAFSDPDGNGNFKFTVESQLKDPKYKAINDTLNSLGAYKDSALRVLDGWNDWFNNNAALAHYITLREANVSRRASAAGVLELMDLHQTGTATPVLRMLYPFVKPTVQSGVALARTLGLAPNAQGKFRPNVKGMATFAGLYAAYSALMPLMKDSMGEDEEGNSYFDMLSVGQLSSFLTAGTGDGNYVKIPVGFGLTQLAITASLCFDRVQRGIMTMDDAGAELIFALGKNVSPGNFPEFSMSVNPGAWLAHMFSPSMLAPITEMATGISHFGRRIERVNYDPTQTKASQGLLSTERSYHEWAKLVENTTGVDLAPEQWKNLLNGLAVGILRAVPGYIEKDELRTKGPEPNARERMDFAGLGPLFSAMGATRVYGATANTESRLYYDALTHYQEKLKESGINLKNTGKKGDELDAEIARRLRRAGWSSGEVADAIQLFRADRQLKSLNSDFKKRIQPIWLSADDSGPVKDEFDKFAVARSDVYSEAIGGLNYYKQRQ